MSTDEIRDLLQFVEVKAQFNGREVRPRRTFRRVIRKYISLNNEVKELEEEIEALEAEIAQLKNGPPTDPSLPPPNLWTTNDFIQFVKNNFSAEDLNFEYRAGKGQGSAFLYNFAEEIADQLVSSYPTFFARFPVLSQHHDAILTLWKPDHYIDFMSDADGGGQPLPKLRWGAPEPV